MARTTDEKEKKKFDKFKEIYFSMFFSGQPIVKDHIAKEMKVTGNTVTAYINRLTQYDYGYYFKEFAPNVIQAIINSSKNGSSKSQELFLKYIMGWAEKTEQKITFDTVPIVVIKKQESNTEE